MAALTILSCLGFLATVVFVSFPALDIETARLFYLGDAVFVGTAHPFVFFMKKLISNLAVVTAVAILIGVAYTSILRLRFPWLTAAQFRFLFYALLIGPGLIVNALFKEVWGRARPNDTELFGGTQIFSPPVVISDQCDTNCSFASGDASFAFFLLAFALLSPPRYRPIATKVAVAFGLFVGAVRMSDGSHFLSDVLFAGIFVGLTIYAAKLLVLEGAWGLEARTYAVVGRLLQAARRAVRTAAISVGQSGSRAVGNRRRPPATGAASTTVEDPVHGREPEEPSQPGGDIPNRQ